jgi:hypothetical protein
VAKVTPNGDVPTSSQLSLHNNNTPNISTVNDHLVSKLCMSLKLLQLSGSKVLVVSFFLASWQREQPASVHQRFNS